MSVSDSVLDATDTPTWHISELLCFIAAKSNIMALDDLVKVCADFYTEVEVVNAGDIIGSCGVRMSKLRNGPDQWRTGHTGIRAMPGGPVCWSKKVGRWAGQQ